jgi:hypothetical protein
VRRLRRAFSAVLAVWFAIAVAEPPALHLCPMHDGAPGMARAHNVAHHAMPAHATGGMLAHHFPDQQRSHQCCCLGACCASVAATVATIEPLPIPALRLASVPVPAPSALAAPVDRRDDHDHPPSIGPPQTLS